MGEERVLRKKILLELPCPLDDSALLAIAKDKSTQEAELEQLEEEFADFKRGWSARIEAKEKAIALLGHQIRTGEQKRVIECFERYQAEGEHAGKVETVRKDTFDVVERRVADLLEARNAVPDSDQEDDKGDVLAQAARMQRAAGVDENDEGDVVPPDEPAPKKRGRGGGKKR